MKELIERTFRSHLDLDHCTYWKNKNHKQQRIDSSPKDAVCGVSDAGHGGRIRHVWCRLFRHPWTVSHQHDNPSIWTVIFHGPSGWNAGSLHDRPREGNLWSHCRTTTSRKSPPSIWFCVCEVVCRSLWRPWLAKPSLWKWSPQTLLKMWRPRFRIKKAFHRPAVSCLCWQAAGGWPHSV